MCRLSGALFASAVYLSFLWYGDIFRREGAVWEAFDLLVPSDAPFNFGEVYIGFCGRGVAGGAYHETTRCCKGHLHRHCSQSNETHNTEQCK